MATATNRIQAAERRLAREAVKAATPAANPPAPPPANRLGSPGATPAGAVKPSLAVIVKRLRPQLENAADLAALREASARLKTEQGIINAHSPLATASTARQLAHVYASAPGVENEGELRHARTLSASDHTLAREYARKRTKAIMSEISPACRAIVQRASELIGKVCEAMSEQERDMWEAWGVTPITSPLVNGLRQWQRELSNEASARVAYDGLPAVVVELLKAEATNEPN